MSWALAHPILKTSGPSLRRIRISTLVLFSIFALMIVVSGVYYLKLQYSAAVDTAMRTARTAASAEQAQARQTFGESFRVTEGIGDVYRELLQHGAVDEAYLHRLLVDKTARVPGVRTFVIFDAKQEAVAGTLTYPVNATSLFASGMSLNTVTEISRDLFVAPVYLDLRPERQGAWHLPLGLFVRDADGTLRAYVVAMLDPDFFAKRYATVDVGAHGRIAMWSANGRLIAENGNDKRGIVDAAMAAEMAKFKETQPTSAVSFSKNHGDGIVTAIMPVGSLPFFISVILDERDFLASWRAARDQIVLTLAGILCAAAVVAFIIVQQIRHTEQNEIALRIAKSAAEEANDAKSRFLAHMSHEFRTPLNAIMGFSEIIKNRVLGGEVSPGYVSYADHIHRSGEHLLHIVNELLDMAKIESGVEPLQAQAVELRGMIGAAIAFCEGMAAQRGVSIRLALPEHLPPISGDQRFSRQVLINLLSNAIKFSPPHSEITVSARYHATHGVSIMVNDHGPGIEPSLLRRLGEPFLQGNPALSHSGQGTGLGLSICKRYMDLLGGDLVIESTTGGGTTAVIRFPSHLVLKAA